MGDLFVLLCAALKEDGFVLPGDSGIWIRPYGDEGFWKEHERSRCVFRDPELQVDEVDPPVNSTFPSCIRSFAEASLNSAWICRVSRGRREVHSFAIAVEMKAKTKRIRNIQYNNRANNRARAKRASRAIAIEKCAA